MKKKIAFIAACIMCLCLFTACPDSVPKELKTTAQMFVDNLAKGDIAKARQHFNQTLKQDMTEASLQQTWSSITAEMGAFVRRVGESQVTEGNNEVVYVTNEFKNGQTDIKVVFDSSRRICGVQWVKETTAMLPANVTEQNLTIKSGQWELPATLTVPVSTVKGIPIIILVHDSGANDRNETIGANAPFRDLAWGLAEKGIAVLRYDKRNQVYGDKSVADTNNYTVYDETIDDVVAAVDMLRSLDDMSLGEIYILGHGLGGMLIPRIAEKATNAVGYIMMAAPARPLEDLALEQAQYLAILNTGKSEAEKTKEVDAVQKQVQNIKNLQSGSTMKAADLLDTPVAYWLDLKNYDPVSAAAGVSKPLFVMQGERDYQVRMTDYNMYKQGIGDQMNVSFMSYPDLNHLFISGTGESTPQEYNVPGHVAEKAIIDICNFINTVHGSQTNTR